MFITGIIFAILAALVHVYIFILESFLWTKPSTIKTFGITKKDAETTKSLAYNQGFYNLFLAIITAIGLVFVWIGTLDVGLALIFAGVGSMVFAGYILVSSDRSKVRAALIQILFPALSIIFLLG